MFLSESICIAFMLLLCSATINGQSTSIYDDISTSILQCRVKRYPKVGLFETALEYLFRIKSESHCVSLCWIYKLHGRNCNSVNYDNEGSVCKLMKEVYDPVAHYPPNISSYDNWDKYVYIVVERCIGEEATFGQNYDEEYSTVPPYPYPDTTNPPYEDTSYPVHPDTSPYPYPDTASLETDYPTPEPETPLYPYPETTDYPDMESSPYPYPEPETPSPEQEPETIGYPELESSPNPYPESETPYPETDTVPYPMPESTPYSEPETSYPEPETTTHQSNQETPQTDSQSSAGTNNFAGKCGHTISDPFRRRIVGGDEARPHSIPWIVSLRKYGYWHSCGGTLIRVNQKDESDIVITAAHCVSSGEANFDVAAGAHLKNETAPGEQLVAAAKVVVHPSYNSPVRVGNDIAVIKLSRPIKFSNSIQPACLPAKGERVSDDANGIIAGWGALAESGSSPNALYQVIVPIVPYEKCQAKYGGNLIDEIMLCGGVDEGGKDSCQGDSGGPYLFKRDDGYTLEGVVSWGFGCARPGTPGVYARVSTYIDWIQEQIAALSEVKA